MLTDAQLSEAADLWRTGKTLGQIAETMKVGLYDLTPYVLRFARTASEREWEDDAEAQFIGEASYELE